MSTSPTTNLTMRQTMLSFAYLAYTGEGITTPNPEASILASIQAALPKIQIASANNATLADWDVVWGPVPYTVPGSLFQDNMLFVVNKSGTSDYVVATRGTNFGSQVDWFLEDFEVINTMKWPMPGAQSNCPEGTVISEATSIGMTIQTDAKLMADSNGVGLLDFLKNTTSSNGKINVCVTGHSLGGVLSNTLALYLTENPGMWDATGQSIVSCVSFAAPTAGNELFAKNAVAVFQKSAAEKGSFPGWDASLGTNLDNVMCNMDIVPLFCTASNVYDAANSKAGKIFDVYASKINSTNNINFDNLHIIASKEWGIFKPLILPAVAGMMEHNYTQLLPDTAFQGEFMGNTLTFESTSGLGPVLEAFAAQAGWQHSNSYPIYLNMPALSDPNIIAREEGPAKSIPTITSISPDSSGSINPLGITVTITGTGFSTSKFSNFIVFSDATNPVPYRMVSATETEIVVVFYLLSTSKGDQNITVSSTSPYFTSNAFPFKIT